MWFYAINVEISDRRETAEGLLRKLAWRIPNIIDIIVLDLLVYVSFGRGAAQIQYKFYR